jgi:hypothetical protein
MSTTRAGKRLLGSVAAAALILGVAAAPSSAASGSTTSSGTCSAGAMSQPFTPFGDSHYYTLAPGGTFDGTAASGWQLSGGASIVQAAQPDGSVRGVLDMPSKSQAVSPVMCITSDYPTSRLWVRNLVGSEGVYFYVSYYVNGAWTSPKNTGQFHGNATAWTLSNPINVQPSSVTGWQQVRFTFIAGGNTSRFQVNDFWVDPRMVT